MVADVTPDKLHKLPNMATERRSAAVTEVEDFIVGVVGAIACQRMSWIDIVNEALGWVGVC